MADLHVLSYVETDIPVGITIAEYRRGRAEAAQASGRARLLWRSEDARQAHREPGVSVDLHLALHE
jgi:hypothetical protein